MSFVETILSLISQKGISKNKMLTDLHLSKNSIVDWGNRGTIPSGETLSKIAAYFNVSTDYLLGNEQKNKPITERDRLIEESIKVMESLPEDLQATAYEQLKSLAALADKSKKR